MKIFVSLCLNIVQMRKLIYPLLLAIGFALGFFFKEMLKGGSHTEFNSDVVLERIRSVAKLTTVEGEYANLYNYNNF